MMSDIDKNGLYFTVIAGSRSVKSSPDTYQIKKSNGYKLLADFMGNKLH
ncbi:MAG: hypothetical protein PHE49_04450 [bacterium]|nr:hypothetical protein [bacterium]